MAYEQLKLSNQLCFRLYTASRLITQSYKPLLDKLGITYPQYLVLMVLWENDNQPVNEIAHRLKLETNTITPVLQRMENRASWYAPAEWWTRASALFPSRRRGRAMEQEAAKFPSAICHNLTQCGLDVETVLGIIPVLDDMIEKINPKSAPTKE